VTEPTPLFFLAGFAVYAYSLCTAAGLALGLALLAISAKAAGERAELALRFGLWALPLGVIGARLMYCAMQAEMFWEEYGVSFVFALTWGGFALAGAMLGVLCAALICAGRSRLPAARMLDLVAPAGALALACARFAEVFTLGGLGREVEDPALWRFPLAVPHALYEGELWCVPVFFWEGLAALLIAGLLFALGNAWRRERRQGDIAALFALIFGASQVLLESLRQDAFLRWGFVRVNQLVCVGLMLAAAVFWGRAALRAGATKGRLLPVAALQLMGIGVLIAIEFALDKSDIPNLLLYAGMAAVLLIMVAAALWLRRYARSFRMPETPNGNSAALPSKPL
jgi:phosphatidylglycerol:prolipoprotein diacylglycerol transferase